jgi:hypothetical protein
LGARTFYDYSWLARPLNDPMMASLSSTIAPRTFPSHMKLMEAAPALGGNSQASIDPQIMGFFEFGCFMIIHGSLDP